MAWPIIRHRRHHAAVAAAASSLRPRPPRRRLTAQHPACLGAWTTHHGPCHRRQSPGAAPGGERPPGHCLESPLRSCWGQGSGMSSSWVNCTRGGGLRVSARPHAALSRQRTADGGRSDSTADGSGVLCCFSLHSPSVDCPSKCQSPALRSAAVCGSGGARRKRKQRCGDQSKVCSVMPLSWFVCL